MESGPFPSTGQACCVAASEHPVPAHAVAECAGMLLEQGAERPEALLVLASTSFTGAMADIASALSRLLSTPRVLVVASRELLLGARRVRNGAGLGAMSLPFPGTAVRHLAVGGAPATAPEGTLVSFHDPYSAPIGAAPGGAAAGSVDVNLLGGDVPGQNRSVVLDPSGVVEHDSGTALLVLPEGVSSVVSAEGLVAFGAPVEVTGSSGSLVTALDGQPAAGALEAAASAAGEGIDAATELGLRVVAATGDPVPAGPLVAVRRVHGGLECSTGLPAGTRVEPVYRCAAATASELSARLGDPGGAVLGLLGVPAASPGRGEPDPPTAALAEAANGRHIGLVVGGFRLGARPGTGARAQPAMPAAVALRVGP